MPIASIITVYDFDTGASTKTVTFTSKHLQSVEVPEATSCGAMGDDHNILNADLTKYAKVYRSGASELPGYVDTSGNFYPVASPSDPQSASFAGRKELHAVSADFQPGTSNLWWVDGDSTPTPAADGQHKIWDVHGPSGAVRKSDPSTCESGRGVSGELAKLLEFTTNGQVVTGGGCGLKPVSGAALDYRRGKLMSDEQLKLIPATNRQMHGGLIDASGSRIAFVTGTESTDSCTLWASAYPAVNPRKILDISGSVQCGVFYLVAIEDR